MLCFLLFSLSWSSSCFPSPFLASLLVSFFVCLSCRLEITSPISSLLYFGYMATASWGFFLLTGSIGFISTLFFVRRIFGAIKVD